MDLTHMLQIFVVDNEPHNFLQVLALQFVHQPSERFIVVHQALDCQSDFWECSIQNVRKKLDNVDEMTLQQNIFKKKKITWQS